MLATAAASTLVALGIIAVTPGPKLQTVALAAGIGAVAAAVVSAGLAGTYRARTKAIVEVGQRYALGDLSRPLTDAGDDELAAAARSLDAAVHELGRRLDVYRRDRARMEAILSSMTEGVLVVDETGRLQVVNEAARRMLRIETNAEGRPYAEAIPNRELVDEFGKVLGGAATEGIEVALRRDGGRDLVARLAPVIATGRGAILVLHDITDLKRADQVRRDFVANVSHELRTPLTAIKGYAEALLEDADDAEARQRFLEVIQRQSARMERLVQDLLRLARLDAGQEPLDRTPTDVAALLHAVVDDLAPLSSDKSLTVVVDADPTLPAVWLDAAKIHDVVRNLVENAVHYTPAGGRIEVVGAGDGQTLSIRVDDTGPGIPPEDLQRIFERFYRVDKSRGRPGGTGLGLAIVRHLTELHGGRVMAAPRPGGGARFELRLPIVPPS